MLDAEKIYYTFIYLCASRWLQSNKVKDKLQDLDLMVAMLYPRKQGDESTWKLELIS